MVKADIIILGLQVTAGARRHGFDPPGLHFYPAKNSTKGVSLRTLIGLSILVVLSVTAILSAPFLIDLNKYQDQQKPLIEEALNRKALTGKVREQVKKN